MPSIKNIEGIGGAYARKLSKAGVRTTESLLKKGGTPMGRKELARASGFTPRKILEWVNRSDLMRVRGVGSEFSDLLEAAGVDTVRELSKRDAVKFMTSLEKTNTSKKLMRRMPTKKQVSAGIRQAKSLPRAVSY